MKNKTGIPLPGPEPPPIQARWIKLTILNDNRVTYNTGFEEIGIYQSNFAFDLLWNYDSSLCVYRMQNQLRIIAKNGKTKTFGIIRDNVRISSFKWINNRELLVVSKGLYNRNESNLQARSTYVKVSRLNLYSGVTERFKQKVKNPQFMFRSIGFMNSEISPYSSSLAFSDGSNINIYDDDQQKIIAKAHINGSIEGIWWLNNNTVIIGQGLLSSPTMKFYAFNVKKSTVNDISSILLPIWSGNYGSYSDDNWFRNAIKE